MDLHFLFARHDSFPQVGTTEGSVPPVDQKAGDSFEQVLARLAEPASVQPSITPLNPNDADGSPPEVGRETENEPETANDTDKPPVETVADTRKKPTDLDLPRTPQREDMAISPLAARPVAKAETVAAVSHVMATEPNQANATTLANADETKPYHSAPPSQVFQSEPQSDHASRLLTSDRFQQGQAQPAGTPSIASHVPAKTSHSPSQQALAGAAQPPIKTQLKGTTDNPKVARDAPPQTMPTASPPQHSGTIQAEPSGFVDRRRPANDLPGRLRQTEPLQTIHNPAGAGQTAISKELQRPAAPDSIPRDEVVLPTHTKGGQRSPEPKNGLQNPLPTRFKHQPNTGTDVDTISTDKGDSNVARSSTATPSNHHTGMDVNAGTIADPKLSDPKPIDQPVPITSPAASSETTVPPSLADSSPTAPAKSPNEGRNRPAIERPVTSVPENSNPTAPPAGMISAALHQQTSGTSDASGIPLSIPAPRTPGSSAIPKPVSTDGVVAVAKDSRPFLASKQAPEPSAPVVSKPVPTERAVHGAKENLPFTATLKASEPTGPVDPKPVHSDRVARATEDRPPLLAAKQVPETPSPVVGTSNLTPPEQGANKQALVQQNNAARSGTISAPPADAAVKPGNEWQAATHAAVSAVKAMPTHERPEPSGDTKLVHSDAKTTLDAGSSARPKSLAIDDTSVKVANKEVVALPRQMPVQSSPLKPEVKEPTIVAPEKVVRSDYQPPENKIDNPRADLLPRPGAQQTPPSTGSSAPVVENRFDVARSSVSQTPPEATPQTTRNPAETNKENFSKTIVAVQPAEAVKPTARTELPSPKSADLQVPYLAKQMPAVAPVVVSQSALARTGRELPEQAQTRATLRDHKAPFSGGAMPTKTALQTANNAIQPIAGSAVAPATTLATAEQGAQRVEFADLMPETGLPARGETVHTATLSAQMATGALRQDIARHVAAQVVEVLPSRVDRPVEIALNPEELGRVRMTLVAGDAGVALSIVAERPETLDLLRRHIDQLANEFRRLGYDSLEFEFSGSGFGQGGATDGSDEQTQTSAPPNDANDPENASPELAGSKNQPAHTTSGLDLRV